MNTLTFEATVTAEHQLYSKSLASLPVGCTVKVTVEPVVRDPILDSGDATFSPQSELGRTLWAIRQRAIAKGMRLQPLDEILEEIRHDRGESGDD
ncbi:conserved hypothetical protein [Gammaproteobacteria bacterium]